MYWENVTLVYLYELSTNSYRHVLKAITYRTLMTWSMQNNNKLIINKSHVKIFSSLIYIFFLPLSLVSHYP